MSLLRKRFHWNYLMNWVCFPSLSAHSLTQQDTQVGLVRCQIQTRFFVLDHSLSLCTDFMFLYKTSEVMDFFSICYVEHLFLGSMVRQCLGDILIGKLCKLEYGLVGFLNPLIHHYNQWILCSSFSSKRGLLHQENSLFLHCQRWRHYWPKVYISWNYHI